MLTLEILGYLICLASDSLLDDLDANQSSSSPRSSSAETPPLQDRSHNNDRASNCSSASAGGPIHGKKARKARTIFTDKQLQELESTFERQKYLSVQDRVDLAHRMGLTDTQVKTWYQNRRQVQYLNDHKHLIQNLSKLKLQYF